MTATSRSHPVLLCFDGSESARRAIAVAGTLGVGGDAVVCTSWTGFSHVFFRGTVGVIPKALEEAVDDLDELDRKAAETLAAEGAALAEAAGFQAVPAAVKQGDKAWRTLLATASERRARLVVRRCPWALRHRAGAAWKRVERRPDPYAHPGAGRARRPRGRPP